MWNQLIYKYNMGKFLSVFSRNVKSADYNMGKFMRLFSHPIILAVNEQHWRNNAARVVNYDR